MTPISVTFKHTVETQITIAANGLTGTVIGMMQDRDSVKWALVEYVDNSGTIHTEWIRETHLN